MAEFATYRSFTDPEEAEALVQVLNHHGIPFRTDRTQMSIGQTFASSAAYEQILVAVPADLFGDADKALEAAMPEETEDAFGEHYLSEFSSDELLEVLHKAHEWNPGDVVVARRLLAKRGVETDAEEIAAKQKAILEAKREPVSGNRYLITFGFFLALLGGILGAALGWSYATLKERDATGTEYYRYNEQTRKLGRWMMLVSGVCFLGWVCVRFGLIAV